MRKLTDTIARLSALKSRPPGAAGSDRLADLRAFGPNPGALRACVYLPAGLPRGAPLVVVLHGCTQTAAGYDHGSGWSTLADRHGFALLFPEQRRENNANLCFNWFEPGDIARDGGEAQSIRAMIAAMVRDHGVDPARVHVTGLSAGGAMTSVMLATYPEVFAGGAIVAGLPFGCAGSVQQAFDRMRGQGFAGEAGLAAAVRRASGHAGRWPAIAVWHGTADRTVDIAAADAIVDQWRGVHGLGRAPDRSDTLDGHPRRVWLDAGGRAAIEEVRIAGMAHGTPLDPRDCGVAGPYMLDVGLSSSTRIAQSWGLIAEGAAAAPPTPTPTPPPASAVPEGIGAVIENALRSAGLMR